MDGVQITTIYHPHLSVAPVMDHNGLTVGGIVNRCVWGVWMIRQQSNKDVLTFAERLTQTVLDGQRKPQTPCSFY